MDQRTWVTLLRSRAAVLTIVGVLVLTASGAGLYWYLSRPPSGSAAASSTPGPSAGSSAAPSIGEVGSHVVTDVAAAEVLTVISTNPSTGGTGAAPRTPIELSFSLPVDPADAQNYFSVLPAREGTFSQGRTDHDIVFTPSSSFGRGSSVSVVMRKGYASRDGYPLENDYSFDFKTALSRAQVVFLVGDQIARLNSVQSGRSASVTLQFGDGVPADTRLQTFRATSSDLLSAFVHRANGTYLDRPISTVGMEPVASRRAVNGRTYTIAQPDGIYLLLAANGQAQYGALWLDFSRFGVILRQDDQKVVVAGADLTDGSTTPTFDITFFKLATAVKPLLSGSFSGIGEFEAPYPAKLDVAIATSGGQEVVIPIEIAQTNADIKVVSDLSAQPQIFVTTDRAGYQMGDVVKFAGVVRMSNDQVYDVPAGMELVVWSGYDNQKPVRETVSVAADGTFRGSFSMPASAFNRKGTDSLMTLFVGTLDQEAADSTPFFTEIAALGDHDPAGTLTVAFDQASYVASDRIVASVSGVDSSGAPLSGKRVRLTIYAAGHIAQPSELDSFAAPSTWGLPVSEDVTISLDADGLATYRFRADLGDKAADQEITLVARYGSGSTAARDAETAIVRQATAAVFLLPARTVYRPDEMVVAPFVVESMEGERAAGVPIAYEIGAIKYKGSKTTTTVVASGTITTSAHGLGVVRATYSGPVGEAVLRVTGKDAAGDEFVDSASLIITTDPAMATAGGAADRLIQLDVLTDKIAYGVGDTARLRVTAPAAMSALITMERGRVHGARWVAFHEGENDLRVNITPDLAPGFTLVFSYVLDGTYVSEGLPMAVSNSQSILNVALTPDQATYGVGDTARVTITVTDSAGAPVSAALLVDAYEAAMSANRLVDQASLAGSFFVPAARGTNGSSSLVGIGNWGGRCGIWGGGNEPVATNPGSLAVWRPHVMTEADGTVTIEVPIAEGPVRLSVFASTSTTLLGQSQIVLGA